MPGLFFISLCFTVFLQMKYAGGQKNFGVKHTSDESIKSQGSFPSFGPPRLDSWTEVSSQRLNLCLMFSWSFCEPSKRSSNTHRCYVGAYVFERNLKCISLISTAIPREQVFISFLKKISEQKQEIQIFFSKEAEKKNL